MHSDFFFIYIPNEVYNNLHHDRGSNSVCWKRQHSTSIILVVLSEVLSLS